MFVVFEHEGLFLRSSTEITQLKHSHCEMEVGAHFAVQQCCKLTARTLPWCAVPALTQVHALLPAFQVLWPGTGSNFS